MCEGGRVSQEKPEKEAAMGAWKRGIDFEIIPSSLEAGRASAESDRQGRGVGHIDFSSQ